MRWTGISSVILRRLHDLDNLRVIGITVSCDRLTVLTWFLLTNTLKKSVEHVLGDFNAALMFLELFDLQTVFAKFEA